MSSPGGRRPPLFLVASPQPLAVEMDTPPSGDLGRVPGWHPQQLTDAHRHLAGEAQHEVDVPVGRISRNACCAIDTRGASTGSSCAAEATAGQGTQALMARRSVVRAWLPLCRATRRPCCPSRRRRCASPGGPRALPRSATGSRCGCCVPVAGKFIAQAPVVGEGIGVDVRRRGRIPGAQRDGAGFHGHSQMNY